MGNLGSTQTPTPKSEKATPNSNNTPSLALARLLPLGGSRETLKGRILTAEEAQTQARAQDVSANVARGKGRI